VKLPGGINSPFWNQRRYKEIKATRRVPGARKCKTLQPAIRKCSTSTAPNSQIRLSYDKAGCQCPKVVFKETLLRISDPNLVEITWFTNTVSNNVGVEVILFTLVQGEDVLLGLDEQKALMAPGVQVRITYKITESTVATVATGQVCFAPHTTELFSFYLEQSAL